MAAPPFLPVDEPPRAALLAEGGVGEGVGNGPVCAKTALHGGAGLPVRVLSDTHLLGWVGLGDGRWRGGGWETSSL